MLLWQTLTMYLYVHHMQSPDLEPFIFGGKYLSGITENHLLHGNWLIGTRVDLVAGLPSMYEAWLLSILAFTSDEDVAWATEDPFSIRILG